MVFWVVAGVLTFGIILLLLWPILSAGTESADEHDRSEEALTVYRDQLSELERDLDAGRLGREEFDAAKLEVQRRMLAADAEKDRTVSASAAAIRKRRLAAAVLVIFLVPAGALLTYVSVGSPGMKDLPLADRTDEAGVDHLAPAGSQSASLAQPGVAQMVSGLEKKLAENPKDADGWALLGRSYMALDRYEDAIGAYGKALALTPDNADLASARGEALVLAADGIVPPAAIKDFQMAHKAEPQEPRARYYLGLARSQAGDPKGALDWWIALEADTPKGAPWEALLKQRIEQTGSEAGIDVAALRAEEAKKRPAAAPGPSPDDIAAAGQMSAGDRAAMIEGMVEKLADRLKTKPDDLDGWQRLARAYDVLGRKDQALAAHAKAAELAPDDLQAQLGYARALFPPGTPESGISDEFIRLVAHIREIAPDNADGLFYGGLVAAHQGDVATAKSLWTTLMEKLGTNAPARAMLKQRIDALGQ